jgi:DNA-binding HxlR family transcriptional regulator
VSPTVLNERLEELRESGIIELTEGEGYALTRLGQELREAVQPLVRWATRWADGVRGGGSA